MTYEQIEITTLQATAGLFRMSAGVLARIAPERENELVVNIKKDQKWKLEHIGGKPASFSADTLKNKVILSSAGLAALWNLAFVAFSVADAGTRARHQAKRNTYSKDKIQHSNSLNLGAYWNQNGLYKRMEYTKALLSDDISWPSDISLPPKCSVLKGSNLRVTNLFLGALAWIMHHEIAHITLEHPIIAPPSQMVLEEYQADKTATEWILSKAGKGLNREFRIMAINVALAYLLLNDSERGHGSKHPPAIARICRTIENYKVSDRSVGLESSAYFLKAIFDPSTQPPECDSARVAFDWVFDRLTLTPQNAQSHPGCHAAH